MGIRDGQPQPVIEAPMVREQHRPQHDAAVSVNRLSFQSPDFLGDQIHTGGEIGFVVLSPKELKHFPVVLLLKKYAFVLVGADLGSWNFLSGASVANLAEVFQGDWLVRSRFLLR